MNLGKVLFSDSFGEVVNEIPLLYPSKVSFIV